MLAVDTGLSKLIGSPNANGTSRVLDAFHADTNLNRQKLAGSTPNACRSRPLIPSLQIKLDPLPFSQSIEVQPVFHAGAVGISAAHYPLKKRTGGQSEGSAIFVLYPLT